MELDRGHFQWFGKVCNIFHFSEFTSELTLSCPNAFCISSEGCANKLFSVRGVEDEGMLDFAARGYVNGGILRLIAVVGLDAIHARR